MKPDNISLTFNGLNSVEASILTNAFEYRELVRRRMSELSDYLLKEAISKAHTGDTLNQEKFMQGVVDEYARFLEGIV